LPELVTQYISFWRFDMMKKQKGMTLIGFIIIAVVALSIILAGVKIVPDYIEFSSVKKVIEAIGKSPNFNNRSEERRVGKEWSARR